MAFLTSFVGWEVINASFHLWVLVLSLSAIRLRQVHTGRAGGAGPRRTFLSIRPASSRLFCSREPRTLLCRPCQSGQCGQRSGLLRPPPRSSSTGSGLARGSLPSCSGRPNDTSKPIGVESEWFASASRNSSTSATKSFDSRSKISGVAAGISSFNSRRRCLRPSNQPSFVLGVRAAISITGAPQ